MADPTRRSQCIIVLGIHGSGTSAVAGILHHLGVMMGETLVPADRTNPKGHFEDLDFRRLLYRYRTDKSALKEIVAYLESRFATYPLWGVKEPAINEAILQIAPYLENRDYKVIATRRDKHACARSYLAKARRGNLPDILRAQGKLRKRRKRFLDEHKPQVLWIKFNDLTEDVEGHVERIAEFVFEGRQPPSPDTVARAVQFVDPTLNHRRERQRDPRISPGGPGAV